MGVGAVSPVDKDETESCGVGVAVLWHDRGECERCKGDNCFVGEAVVRHLEEVVDWEVATMDVLLPFLDVGLVVGREASAESGEEMDGVDCMLDGIDEPVWWEVVIEEAGVKSAGYLLSGEESSLDESARQGDGVCVGVAEVEAKLVEGEGRRKEVCVERAV